MSFSLFGICPGALLSCGQKFLKKNMVEISNCEMVKIFTMTEAKIIFFHGQNYMPKFDHKI